MGWLMKRFVRKTERRLFWLAMVLLFIGGIIIGIPITYLIIIVIILYILKFITKTGIKLIGQKK